MRTAPKLALSLETLKALSTEEALQVAGGLKNFTYDLGECPSLISHCCPIQPRGY